VLNLAEQPVPLSSTDRPPGKVIFETPPRARDRVDDGELPAQSVVGWLTGDVCEYATGHDARHRAHQE
jgi:maltooligosyltrehalose trehalohydrolase